MNQMPEWSVTTYADYVKAALGVLTGQPQSLVVNPKFTYCWPHGSASDNYNVVLGFNCADENSCKNLAEKINAIREEIGDCGIIAYDTSSPASDTTAYSFIVCIDPDYLKTIEKTIDRMIVQRHQSNPSPTLLDNMAVFLWDLRHHGSQ
jgi:hypothetical protein